MGCDTGLYVAMAFTAVALAISVCLNVIFYSLRRREMRRKASEEYPYPGPEACFMECPRGAEVEQDNPIYGNINPDGAGAGGIGGGGEVFYERMTTCPREREEKRPLQQDVSYASLDLGVGQKRRKKQRRPKQHPRLGQSLGEEPEAGPGAEPGQGAEPEPGMPCRYGSPMASHNSIYLNSQQVAVESEELDRRLEREREDLMDFDPVHDDPARFYSRTNQSQAFMSDR